MSRANWPLVTRREFLVDTDTDDIVEARMEARMDVDSCCCNETDAAAAAPENDALVVEVVVVVVVVAWNRWISLRTCCLVTPMPNSASALEVRVRITGFGFRVSGNSSFGFWVSGFGFQVSGFGFQVSGFTFQFRCGPRSRKSEVGSVPTCM